MKNSIISLTIILFTLIILNSCKKDSGSSGSSGSTSSSTEGYTRENVPANTTVSLPSTLTSKASSSRTAYASLDNSLGLVQVQNSVVFMKLFLTQAEFNLILMDAAISQSKFSVGNCYAAGEIKITFTAEMLQALKDVYSKLDSEMSDSDNSTYSDMVGTEISLSLIHI